MTTGLYTVNFNPLNCGGCPARFPRYQALSVRVKNGDATSLSKKIDGNNETPGKPVNTAAAGGELSLENQNSITKLKQIDRQVKAHEQSHIAAGAELVRGGARYVYVTGPDGKSYAVSGEVKIDTSRERDPEETIRKMQRVRATALAPSDPSGTDQAVAAKAAQIELQARLELSRRESENTDKSNQPADPIGNKNPNQTELPANPYQHTMDQVISPMITVFA